MDTFAKLFTAARGFLHEWDTSEGAPDRLQQDAALQLAELRRAAGQLSEQDIPATQTALREAEQAALAALKAGQDAEARRLAERMASLEQNLGEQQEALQEARRHIMQISPLVDAFSVAEQERQADQVAATQQVWSDELGVDLSDLDSKLRAAGMKPASKPLTAEQHLAQLRRRAGKD